MTTLTHRRAWGSSLLERLANRLNEMNARNEQNRVYRETRDELLSLSKRELTDIGIHPSQIEEIALQAAQSR